MQIVICILASIVAGFSVLMPVRGWSEANLSWNLNDVTFLFNIPGKEANDLSQLLAPTAMGPKGVLLPKSIYEQVPPLVAAGAGNETYYNKNLRVVAVRFDPCASDQCEPEFRMVWQPIEKNVKTGEWEALDAAVHSFYRLSEIQREAVSHRLWSLKIESESWGVTTTGVPLNIHPALMNLNYADQFNQKLLQMLVEFCGEENLYQLTFMELLVPSRWWRFGGFKKNNQKQWQAFEVPRIGALTEDIFNTGFEEGSSYQVPGKAMDAVFNVLPDDYPEEDIIYPIINRGDRKNNESDEPIFKELFRPIERFRNPKFTNSNNLDCASCHYADAARFFSEQRFPRLKNFQVAEAFENPNPQDFDLTNTTIAKEATRIVRALGYFVDQPAINQRTINESAVSASWLNNN
ncbi:MAG: hypothetical protein H6626_09160 [Pseudobdellovibrionaceae bacterium]|nr:hypothetical protein [Bdellovibrionales bacterium]USN46384.1 MAG: hypothetical protein H6626_09160 [Pseudobdellovibrionaceae bacterium]